MKHPNIMIGKMGWARRGRGIRLLNWEYAAKRFPSHREHIRRIRKDATKLAILFSRLVKEAK